VGRVGGAGGGGDRARRRTSGVAGTAPWRTEHAQIQGHESGRIKRKMKSAGSTLNTCASGLLMGGEFRTGQHCVVV